MGYEWPGNVRQLENAVEMAVALSGDRDLLDLEDFPVVSRRPSKLESFDTIEIPDDGIHFNTMISELERKLILQSLQIARGNKKRAASLLHLKRTTFVEKLRRMGYGLARRGNRRGIAAVIGAGKTAALARRQNQFRIRQGSL